MACKKSELVTAINSFATARATGDAALQQMSAQLLQDAVDSLEYAPEEEAETEEDSVEN
jgi:tRNA U34 5-methylaminomethyl-2-thiouridine-forming methyltransferase MnmC